MTLCCLDRLLLSLLHLKKRLLIKLKVGRTGLRLMVVAQVVELRFSCGLAETLNANMGQLDPVLLLIELDWHDSIFILLVLQGGCL